MLAAFFLFERFKEDVCQEVIPVEASATTREKLKTRPLRLLWKDVREWFRENCYLYHKVYAAIYFHYYPEARYREVAAGYTSRQLEDLAAGTVGYYARSLDLLDHLSRAYNFKYLCFWQPALFTEPKVLPGETKIDVRLGDRKFTELYRLTNDCLAKARLPRVYNVADAVSQRNRPCYLDLVHMTEEGYGQVAARLYQVLRQEFAWRD